jgi:predicted amidohydrolase
VRVALVQPVFDADTDRVETVLSKVHATKDADLIVLPELWHVGYFAFDDYEARAESLEGPTVTALRDAAIDRAIYLHAGSIVERTADGRLHNTSILIAPDGSIAGTYRKVHLFGYRSRETELLTPGRDFGVISTDIGKIAMTTCYDLRFPELYRAVGDADLFVVASAWPIDRIEHWRLLTHARALENLAYLVACNAAGIDNGITLGGHSVVVDPWGDVIAEATTGDEVIGADIDIPRVAKLRSEFPWTSDRRFEVELP